MNRHLRTQDDRPGVRHFSSSVGFRFRAVIGTLAAFAVLVLLHYPLLRLPYYWDEAGYYIPAAMDFYRSGQLIPSTTLPTGHTPLVVIYLALAWRVFGFSALVTRVAMIVVAACTLVGVYALGRPVANREVAYWSVLLLALLPLFFAQSVLVHLDLAAGLFTLLALLALLEERPWGFAFASTCAVLSKETAVVLLPVAWIFSWRQHRRATSPVLHSWWAAWFAPLVVLAAWVTFYHHATGFWTGNREYLRYNLYSTLNPLRMSLTLVRRLYQTFVGGFNWLLTAGAIIGTRWAWRHEIGGHSPEVTQVRGPRTTLQAQPTPHDSSEAVVQNQLGPSYLRRFLFLVGLLTAAYLAMLSLVGGAVLPRYLLPVFPPLILAAVTLIWRLPRPAARSIMVLTAGCFVWAWSLNPPYPFPFEDNLAYADFIRLHEQAARFLEASPGNRRILTAWPASDELTQPFLGYVRQRLQVVVTQGFGRDDFESIAPESFDCLYLYARRWEPSKNWLTRFPWLQRLQKRYFDYHPQITEQEVTAKFHLRLLAHFERRCQWVRIYVRQ